MCGHHDSEVSDLYTTGEIARQLGISREQLVKDLVALGLEPARTPSGRRLLTEKDVRALEQLREERRRRQALRRAPYR